MAEEKIRVSALLVQCLSTLSIACLLSQTGLIYAWPSYTIELLESDDTVLSRPMTKTEVSLLGGLTNLGGLVATPLCGMSVSYLGRKYSAMLFGLPFAVAWAIIIMTTSVPVVLGAVFLTGFGAAGQVISTVYISEISQDSIRGLLTSTTVSGYFIGLLLGYIFGSIMTYYQVLYTHLTFSVAYLLVIGLLKDTPVFLMQKGKEEEAAKSIAFYRHVDVTSKEVDVEIKKIKMLLDPRIDEILHAEALHTIEEKELMPKEKIPELPEVKPMSSWKFLLQSESSKRALFQVLCVMSLTILMGPIVLQVYAEPLFKEAVPSISSRLCATLMAIDFLIPSLLCGLVVDRFGRRSLLTYTSLLSGCFTLLLGTQLHFMWGPHWVTVLFIFGYCFVYNLGAASVPFILTAEVFLPEVRELGNSFSMACMWIMNFVTLMIFNPMVDKLGLGPLFYFFTVMCFIGAAYSNFYLPETKGLPVDAIQLLLLKPEKTPKVPR